VSIFSDRLQARRKSLGLTLDALAAKAGMSKTGLWQLDTGKSFPDADTLLKLGQALGVSLDWLMGMADDPSPPGCRDENPPVPADLAALAERQYLSWHTVRTLLALHAVISLRRHERPGARFNWARFHSRIKEFL
jgi:transcriptional regulator with XRE-family HTH domain